MAGRQNQCSEVAREGKVPHKSSEVLALARKTCPVPNRRQEPNEGAGGTESKEERVEEETDNGAREKALALMQTQSLHQPVQEKGQSLAVQKQNHPLYTRWLLQRKSPWESDSRWSQDRLWE